MKQMRGLYMQTFFTFRKTLVVSGITLKSHLSQHVLKNSLNKLSD